MLTQDEKLKMQEYKKVEELKAFFEDSLEKSINYNNAIISIGYVSFFAILLLVKDVINTEVMCKIATYTLISLGFYVIWLVISMVINSIDIIKVCWKFLNQVRKRILMIFWPIFLCLTIVPVLYAVVLLVQSLFNYLKAT